VSEDPIGFGGGDVNLFGYVGNSPQNFVDPTGNFPMFIGIHGLIPPKDRNLDCVPEECKKDIGDMIRDMERVRDEMNSDGRRVPGASGTWNNVRASANAVVNTYMFVRFGVQQTLPNIQGCVGQSDCALRRQQVRDPLKDSYDYEKGYDLLGIKDVGDLPITTHKWVKAIPKNPKCPKVRLDSWADSWELLK
jgi:hypothetical protein